MSDERMVKVSASLPPDMAGWLVFIAERKGITGSEVICRALNVWLLTHAFAYVYRRPRDEATGAPVGWQPPGRSENLTKPYILRACVALATRMGN